MKMALKEELMSTNMSKSVTVASYLPEITHVPDKLEAIEEIVTNAELVRVAQNGVTKPSTPFVKGSVARENLPRWERLWDDFIQEET